MKSFLELVEEETKAVAMLFGRMNPPTAGHEENINGLKELAAKHNADHVVIASHSNDPKKNPLTPEQKEKHLRRAFPGTNIVMASRQSPTLMHHAQNLHKQGYTHLIVAGGGDRAGEYEKLLKKYNGKFDEKGNGYNFKKITVASTGERREGVSGTDMRNHVRNNNYQEFKNNLPSHMQGNDKHARELFQDVRRGMGINENTTRGMFRAMFLVGGPGSGKNVIIHEALAERNAVEINSNKAYDFLMDKKRLSEETKDNQLNAIRNRQALVINGPSDDREKITSIKEELEELGYTTMMVFVNTSNEVSMSRNLQHSRIISEQIRNDKWQKSQDNMDYFYELFDYFMEFDNSVNLNESNTFTRDLKENEISEICNEISFFYKSKQINENAKDWLRQRGMLNINEDIKTLFDKGTLNEKTMGCDCGSTKKSGVSTRIIRDNNSPVDQFLRKSGKIDDVRDGDIKPNSGYVWNTYEEKEEEVLSQPKLKVNAEPKTSRFNTDKETKNSKKIAGVNLLPGKGVSVDGIRSTYDTRGQGTVYPMSGLGNVTYSESFSKFRNKLKKESIDSPSTEMGVTGGEYGPSNKEPMDTLNKIPVTGIIKKKKLKEQEGEGHTPETLAKKHGVGVDFINKQIEIGKGIELEHTKSKSKAVKIAMDHLAEFPDYYSRLVKMEKQAKKQEK